MSTVHYASLYRWDELAVLLIRSPWLAKEPGLYDVMKKVRAPDRIWDILFEAHQGPWSPATQYPLSGPFPLDHFGNAIVGGREHEYDDSGDGVFASSAFAIKKKRVIS